MVQYYTELLCTMWYNGFLFKALPLSAGVLLHQRILFEKKKKEYVRKRVGGRIAFMHSALPFQDQQ